MTTRVIQKEKKSIPVTENLQIKPKKGNKIQWVEVGKKDGHGFIRVSEEVKITQNIFKT